MLLLSLGSANGGASHETQSSPLRRNRRRVFGGGTGAAGVFLGRRYARGSPPQRPGGHRVSPGRAGAGGTPRQRAGAGSRGMKPVSGKDLCKALECKGWVCTRTRGSHRHYGKAGGPSVTVPVHGNKILKPRTQRNIMKTAERTDADL